MAVTAAVLAAAVVGCQIAYPLTPAGPARDRLTVVTVVVFFAASVTAAMAARGTRFASVLVAVTAGGGLLVEALGVATGVPFGAYAYNESLGARLLGVPLVIPLAWTMMGYPALVVGLRIAKRGWRAVVAAGAALATWDLFLDPQMVDAGHWTWAGTSGPELTGVPVLNFVGWFVVAILMMALLVPLTDHLTVQVDRVPIALYLWTYASSVLAHAVFFDLRSSAIVGGLGMGVIVALLVRALRRQA